MKKSDLIIGVVKEIYQGCRCVALVPDMVKTFVKNGHTVLVQSDAGKKAYYTNEAYVEAGARMIDTAQELYSEANVIFKLRPPLINQETGKHELDMLKPGTTFMGFLSPTIEKSNVHKLMDNKLTGFAMELIPRICRGGE